MEPQATHSATQPAEPVVLLPGDTCDKCGPHIPANTAIRLISGGELRFCNHCYDAREPSLAPLVTAFTRNEVR